MISGTWPESKAELLANPLSERLFGKRSTRDRRPGRARQHFPIHEQAAMSSAETSDTLASALPHPRTAGLRQAHAARGRTPPSARRTPRAAGPGADPCRRRRRSPSVASLHRKGCRGVATSGRASSADHGVDAGAGYGPRTVLSNGQFPPASIERRERRVDRDLHLTGGGCCGPGDRVDRAVAGERQGPPGATAVAIRRTISCTDPATWTYRHVTRSWWSGCGVQVARSPSTQVHALGDVRPHCLGH